MWEGAWRGRGAREGLREPNPGAGWGLCALRPNGRGIVLLTGPAGGPGGGPYPPQELAVASHLQLAWFPSFPAPHLPPSNPCPLPYPRVLPPCHSLTSPPLPLPPCPPSLALPPQHLQAAGLQARCPVTPGPRAAHPPPRQRPAPAPGHPVRRCRRHCRRLHHRHTRRLHRPQPGRGVRHSARRRHAHTAGGVQHHHGGGAVRK